MEQLELLALFLLVLLFLLVIGRRRLSVLSVCVVNVIAVGIQRSGIRCCGCWLFCGCCCRRCYAQCCESRRSCRQVGVWQLVVWRTAKLERTAPSVLEQ